LFVVATVAILAVGTSHLQELGGFLRLVVLITFAGTAGFVLLLSPSKFSDWLFAPMMRLPAVGHIVVRVRATLELYRKRRLWLLAIGLLSVAVHCLVAVSMHFSDRSIHPTTPSLTEHLIISPLASVASAAPVPGGLGTYEFAMDYLFQKIPARTVEKGQGLSVAVVYRLLTVIIAGIGVVYYLLNRQALSEAVSSLESEKLQAAPDSERFREETNSHLPSDVVKDM
jgi:uncharacterized membrane protein YbhN (UPF0104 family)